MPEGSEFRIKGAVTVKLH